MGITIDKIPIKMFSSSPGDEVFRLGTVELSKGEYANAEKINQILDELVKISERLSKVEGK